MSPWLGGPKKEPTGFILGGAQLGYSRRHLAVGQHVYEIVGWGHSGGQGPRMVGRPAGIGQAHRTPAALGVSRGPKGASMICHLTLWTPWSLGLVSHSTPPSDHTETTRIKNI